MPTIGTYRHLVTLETPGVPVPDGEGGFTDGWTPLDPPTWHCSIRAASARDLETLGGGTVLAQATHVIKGHYHKGLTTKARLQFEGRMFSVVLVVNVDERDIETNLVCAEVIE
jgi:SPP1 family predicted phage head-tail adaptor